MEQRYYEIWRMGKICKKYGKSCQAKECKGRGVGKKYCSGYQPLPKRVKGPLSSLKGLLKKL